MGPEGSEGRTTHVKIRNVKPRKEIVGMGQVACASAVTQEITRCPLARNSTCPRGDDVSPNGDVGRSLKEGSRQTSAGDALIKVPKQQEPLPRRRCDACRRNPTNKATVCCRTCYRQFHPICIGFNSAQRLYSPPEWKCPYCGGERGSGKIHPCFEDKGKSIHGVQPWCPVCFKDNRVKRKSSQSGLTGRHWIACPDGVLCPGCGLRAHGACVRSIRRPDQSWPCPECDLRQKGRSIYVAVVGEDALPDVPPEIPTTEMSSSVRSRKESGTALSPVARPPSRTKKRTKQSVETKGGRLVDAKSTGAIIQKSAAPAPGPAPAPAAVAVAVAVALAGIEGAAEGKVGREEGTRKASGFAKTANGEGSGAIRTYGKSLEVGSRPDGANARGSMESNDGNHRNRATNEARPADVSVREPTPISSGTQRHSDGDATAETPKKRGRLPARCPDVHSIQSFSGRRTGASRISSTLLATDESKRSPSAQQNPVSVQTRVDGTTAVPFRTTPGRRVFSAASTSLDATTRSTPIAGIFDASKVPVSSAAAGVAALPGKINGSKASCEPAMTSVPPVSAAAHAPAGTAYGSPPSRDDRVMSSPLLTTAPLTVSPSLLFMPSVNSLRWLPTPPSKPGLAPSSQSTSRSPSLGPAASVAPQAPPAPPRPLAPRQPVSSIPASAPQAEGGLDTAKSRMKERAGASGRTSAGIGPRPMTPQAAPLEVRDKSIAVESVRRVRRSGRNAIGTVPPATSSSGGSQGQGHGAPGEQACVKCRLQGRKKGGRRCGSCGRWWHLRCAESYGGSEDVSRCPGAGDWVGGFRCFRCLRQWEHGLKERASAVVAAWEKHEERRRAKAASYASAAAAAAAEATETKSFGFLVGQVELDPIPFPPAGILPFLNVEAIQDTGFRLARFTREDCCFIGPDGITAKVDICWEQRIFAIVEGAFDRQRQPLMEFLSLRKSLACKISGKASTGEASSTMGDYMQKLEVYDHPDRPTKDNPGTFFLDTAHGQDEVLEWLPEDPFMGHLLPEAPRGGLRDHCRGDKCKFGPFTFGGGRNYPLANHDAAHAGRMSRRQYLQGKRRERIGGSTTHMDGMGSFTAIGGVKAGIKSVTAFETADCATALAVAKFKSYAKPGGSSYVVNSRIDDDLTLRDRFRAAGVRFRTFLVREGDGYLVPSGALHEFMNLVPCLSVAWNIMPYPTNCESALRLAFASADEAEVALGVNTDRSQSAIEHAPPEPMRERGAAHIIKRALARRLSLRRRRLDTAQAAAAREAAEAQVNKRFLFRKSALHLCPAASHEEKTLSASSSSSRPPTPPSRPTTEVVVPTTPPPKASAVGLPQARTSVLDTQLPPKMPPESLACGSPIAPLTIGGGASLGAIGLLPPPPRLFHPRLAGRDVQKMEPGMIDVGTEDIMSLSAAASTSSQDQTQLAPDKVGTAGSLRSILTAQDASVLPPQVPPASSPASSARDARLSTLQDTPVPVRKRKNHGQMVSSEGGSKSIRCTAPSPGGGGETRGVSKDKTNGYAAGCHADGIRGTKELRVQAANGALPLVNGAGRREKDAGGGGDGWTHNGVGLEERVPVEMLKNSSARQKLPSDLRRERPTASKRSAVDSEAAFVGSRLCKAEQQTGNLASTSLSLSAVGETTPKEEPQSGKLVGGQSDVEPAELAVAPSTSPRIKGSRPRGSPNTKGSDNAYEESKGGGHFEKRKGSEDPAPVAVSSSGDNTAAEAGPRRAEGNGIKPDARDGHKSPQPRHGVSDANVGSKATSTTQEASDTSPQSPGKMCTPPRAQVVAAGPPREVKKARTAISGMARCEAGSKRSKSPVTRASPKVDGEKKGTSNGDKPATESGGGTFCAKSSTNRTIPKKTRDSRPSSPFKRNPVEPASKSSPRSSDFKSGSTENAVPRVQAQVRSTIKLVSVEGSSRVGSNKPDVGDFSGKEHVASTLEDCRQSTATTFNRDVVRSAVGSVDRKHGDQLDVGATRVGRDSAGSSSGKRSTDDRPCDGITDPQAESRDAALVRSESHEDGQIDEVSREAPPRSRSLSESYSRSRSSSRGSSRSCSRSRSETRRRGYLWSSRGRNERCGLALRGCDGKRDERHGIRGRSRGSWGSSSSRSPLGSVSGGSTGESSRQGGDEDCGEGRSRLCGIHRRRQESRDRGYSGDGTTTSEEGSNGRGSEHGRLRSSCSEPPSGRRRNREFRRASSASRGKDAAVSGFEPEFPCRRGAHFDRYDPRRGDRHECRRPFRGNDIRETHRRHSHRRSISRSRERRRLEGRSSSYDKVDRRDEHSDVMQSKSRRDDHYPGVMSRRDSRDLAGKGQSRIDPDRASVGASSRRGGHRELRGARSKFDDSKLGDDRNARGRRRSAQRKEDRRVEARDRSRGRSGSDSDTKGRRNADSRRWDRNHGVPRSRSRTRDEGFRRWRDDCDSSPGLSYSPGGVDRRKERFEYRSLKSRLTRRYFRDESHLPIKKRPRTRELDRGRQPERSSCSNAGGEKTLGTSGEKNGSLCSRVSPQKQAEGSESKGDGLGSVAAGSGQDPKSPKERQCGTQRRETPGGGKRSSSKSGAERRNPMCSTLDGEPEVSIPEDETPKRLHEGSDRASVRSGRVRDEHDEEANAHGVHAGAHSQVMLTSLPGIRTDDTKCGVPAAPSDAAAAVATDPASRNDSEGGARTPAGGLGNGKNLTENPLTPQRKSEPPAAKSMAVNGTVPATPCSKSKRKRDSLPTVRKTKNSPRESSKRKKTERARTSGSKPDQTTCASAQGCSGGGEQASNATSLDASVDLANGKPGLSDGSHSPGEKVGLIQEAPQAHMSGAKRSNSSNAPISSGARDDCQGLAASYPNVSPSAGMGNSRRDHDFGDQVTLGWDERQPASMSGGRDSASSEEGLGDAGLSSTRPLGCAAAKMGLMRLTGRWSRQSRDGAESPGDLYPTSFVPRSVLHPQRRDVGGVSSAIPNQVSESPSAGESRSPDGASPQKLRGVTLSNGGYQSPKETTMPAALVGCRAGNDSEKVLLSPHAGVHTPGAYLVDSAKSPERVPSLGQAGSFPTTRDFRCVDPSSKAHCSALMGIASLAAAAERLQHQ